MHNNNSNVQYFLYHAEMITLIIMEFQVISCGIWSYLPVVFLFWDRRFHHVFRWSPVVYLIEANTGLFSNWLAVYLPL